MYRANENFYPKSGLVLAGTEFDDSQWKKWGFTKQGLNSFLKNRIISEIKEVKDTGNEDSEDSKKEVKDTDNEDSEDSEELEIEDMSLPELNALIASICEDLGTETFIFDNREDAIKHLKG